MQVHAKLGCLLSARRISSDTYYQDEGPRWTADYATTLVKFARPEEGVSRLAMECPKCRQYVSFDVASAGNVQIKVFLVALAVAGLVLAAGWWVWSTYEAHEVGRPAGVGLVGIGGVGLFLTLLLGLANPALFDFARGALTISQDNTKSVQGAPTISVNQHKLMQVWHKPDERSKQTPAS